MDQTDQFCSQVVKCLLLLGQDPRALGHVLLLRERFDEDVMIRVSFFERNAGNDLSHLLINRPLIDLL